MLGYIKNLLQHSWTSSGVSKTLFWNFPIFYVWVTFWGLKGQRHIDLFDPKGGEIGENMKIPK